MNKTDRLNEVSKSDTQFFKANRTFEMSKRFQDVDVEIVVGVLGDSGVGKQALCVRIDRDKFCDGWASNYDDRLKRVSIDGMECGLAIQMFMKQRRFTACGQLHNYDLPPNFFPAINIILIAVDMTQQNTFGAVEHIYELAKQYGKDGPLLVAVGTRADLKDGPDEKINQLCDRFSLPFVMTSAKTGLNVQALLRTIAHMHLRRAPIVSEVRELSMLENAKPEGPGPLAALLETDKAKQQKKEVERWNEKMTRLRALREHLADPRADFAEEFAKAQCFCQQQEGCVSLDLS